MPGTPPAATLPAPRHVKALGLATAYVELGPPDAEPVVFVHGYASNHLAWKENLLDLSRSYRAIALDLAGHGGTAKPLAPYTITYYARHVASFLEALKLERVTLVGVSLGGAIAGTVALRWPERLARLVLVDAAGVGRKGQSWASRRRFLPALFWQVLGRPKRPVLRRFLEEAIFASPELATDAVIDEMVDAHQNSRLAALFTGFTLMLPDAYLYPKLSRIQLPTLIVWGSEDRTFPVSDAYDAARQIPGARVEVLEGVGHVPMQERPQAFNRILRDFIENAS
ncbi:MAG TPA: alpha/beta fold hydrolase [Limnochorda sp.]